MTNTQAVSPSGARRSPANGGVTGGAIIRLDALCRDVCAPRVAEAPVPFSRHSVHRQRSSAPQEIKPPTRPRPIPRRTHQPAPDRVQFLSALLFGVDVEGVRHASTLPDGARRMLPFRRGALPRWSQRWPCVVNSKFPTKHLHLHFFLPSYDLHLFLLDSRLR